jgi:hypothetical protein
MTRNSTTRTSRVPLLLTVGAVLTFLAVREAARETHVVKILSGPHVTQSDPTGRVTLTTYQAQETR